jgi:hypothetical protein
MYGGLSQLHGHVHGDHDAVHEERKNGYEDDDHVHGLHGDVRDVRQLHDAHVSYDEKDVRDVYRDVHDVRGHVRGHERQSDDDALRRDVSAVRRVLLHDCEDDEGRLSPERDAQQGSGTAHSAPGPVRGSPITVTRGLFANQENQVIPQNPPLSAESLHGSSSLCACVPTLARLQV